MPEPDVAAAVKNAAEFAGTYRGDQGSLEVLAEGDRLFVAKDGERVPLERLADPNRFAARHPRFDRFAFAFGRTGRENPG